MSWLFVSLAAMLTAFVALSIARPLAHSKQWRSLLLLPFMALALYGWQGNPDMADMPWRDNPARQARARTLDELEQHLRAMQTKPPAIPTTDDWVLLGRLQLALGARPEAKNALQEASLQGTDGVAELMLAKLILADDANNRGAEKLLLQATHKNPQLFLAWVFLASFYESQGEMAKAEQARQFLQKNTQ